MKRRRFRRILLGCVGVALLVAGLLWQWSSTRHLQPGQFLAQVVQLEQSEASGSDPLSLQSLGWALAILGRDDEVRAMDFHPQWQRPPSPLDMANLELHVVPWQEGMQKIAADHRIVMIMEDHCSSKHREFVGATLPILGAAGFRYYAAEAIGPIDRRLGQRGYPTSRTGLYTSDPQFGNTLRRAMELNFSVRGYDFCYTSHDAREAFAAKQLARIVQDDAEARLVVHAGHAHVLKYATDSGERWLASRLWEITGIEPFTIWQWSSCRAAKDYAEIMHVLKKRGVDVDEPVLLMPPPDIDCGLQDPPYRLASVDAIVLHPIDQSTAPAERTVLFPEGMRSVAGRWTASRWPVVVSAYRRGEPVDAVPLDQVMLRQNEARFLLWIPAEADYVIRVFDAE